jgi:hypothetical protein
MQSLLSNCPRDFKEQKPHGAELSAMVYSLYQFIDMGFSSSPTEVLKVKVADTKAMLDDKDFIITITPVPNPTVAGSVLKVLLKRAAAASKLKAMYKKYMEICGLKFEETPFATALGIVLHAIKHIKIAIVGVKMTKEKETTIREALTKIIATFPAGAAGKLPDGVKDTEPVIRTGGKDKLGMLLLYHYLKANKISSNIVDGSLVPVMLARQWPGAQKKLQDGIETYVDVKYVKHIEKLGDLFRVMAVHDGYFTPDDLKAISDAPTRASLVALLKKSLS